MHISKRVTAQQLTALLLRFYQTVLESGTLYPQRGQCKSGGIEMSMSFTLDLLAKRILSLKIIFRLKIDKGVQ